MEHQDWTIVALKNSNKTKKPQPQQPQQLQQPQQPSQPQQTIKVVMKEPIGKLIAQARMIHGKNQKELAAMIGVSQQFIARWEANKELPNNAQIALIEKTLKVKLPRSQKIYIDEK
jgi:ribosome-binding protein aMBF1 (putative translation factor)